MQNVGFWEKLLICIIVSPLIIFLGFIGVIFSALMGGFKFYTPLIIVVTVGFIVFYIISVFNLLRPSVFKKSFYEMVKGSRALS